MTNLALTSFTTYQRGKKNQVKAIPFSMQLSAKSQSHSLLDFVESFRPLTSTLELELFPCIERKSENYAVRFHNDLAKMSWDRWISIQWTVSKGKRKT